MSLIINALKKAEDGGDDQSKPQPIPEHKPKNKMGGKYSLKSDIFFIAVFATIIGVFVSFFMLKFVDMQKGKAPATKTEQVKNLTVKKEITLPAKLNSITQQATTYVENIAKTVSQEQSTPVPVKPAAVKVLQQASVIKTPNPVSVKPAPVEEVKQLPIHYRSGDYILNGIMYDEKKPMALINNKMVFEGKIIGALKVVRITEEEVFVEINNKKYILSME